MEVMVRLSGEDTFAVLTLPEASGPSPGGHDPGIRELFWRIADLAGHDLVLGQQQWRAARADGPGAFECSNAAVAYIKLVPLTDAEVNEYKADQDRADTRRVFVHNDSHGVMTTARPTTAEEIRRHVESYRDCDIGRVYWESGMGDLLHYFSKIGRIPSYDGLEDYVTPNYRYGTESWRAFRDQGIDPFQVALDHAHKLGIEFHASYRVAGFHFPPQHDHFNYRSSFYDHHPEWRGVDRNGNVTPRLSYAYPGVRRFVVLLLREMAGFDIDGVCLLYNRRPPLVEYEPPVVDGFKAEYGEDPRKLDESDPRWLAYKARILTEFHREVRHAMDGDAERRGRRKIEVSAVVMSSEQENLHNAMDLRTWVDEGLVDTIIPYTSEPGLDSRLDSWTDPRDAEFFVSLTKGASCKLAVGLMPRHLTAEEYWRRAAALYEVGVDSFFAWDSDFHQARSDNSNSWNGLRRLGHRDEIEAWVRAGESDLTTPVTPLSKLGDWDLSYQTPG